MASMHLSTQYLKVLFQSQIFTESNNNNFIRVFKRNMTFLLGILTVRFGSVPHKNRIEPTFSKNRTEPNREEP